MPQMQPMQPMGMRGGYPQQQQRGRGAYGARGNGVTECCSDPPFSRAGG
jgi:hypothetical protein